MIELKIFIFIFFISLAGIVSAAAELEITSTPDTSIVYLRQTSGQNKVKLGTTPLKINMGQLINSYAKGNSNFILEVQKPNYTPYNLMVSMLNAKNSIKLNVNLKISRDLEVTRKFDKIAQELFEGQRLIRNKNYDAAIKKFTSVETKFPELSVIPELKGSAYYLKKDFTKALGSFRKAFSINAQNSDAYSMKLYLEKNMGVKGAK